jgi:hypothetical protein
MDMPRSTSWPGAGMAGGPSGVWAAADETQRSRTAAIGTRNRHRASVRQAIPYSHRSAAIGSTFVARRAGSHTATAAMSTSPVTAAVAAVGSEGSTPNN